MEYNMVDSNDNKLQEIALQISATNEEYELQDDLYCLLLGREPTGEEVNCHYNLDNFNSVQGILLQRILKLTMEFQELCYYFGDDCNGKAELLRKERELLLQYAACIFYPEFKEKIMTYKRENDCE
jgi:hypothetical protein